MKSKVITHAGPTASHDVLRNGVNLVFHFHLLLAISFDFHQENSEVGSSQIKRQEFPLFLTGKKGRIYHVQTKN